MQTAFLGDVVLTTPLLRELRRSRPAARIVALATPAGGRLLRGQPFVDDVVEFDKRWNPAGLRSYLGVLSRLAALRPSVAIAAQRSLRSGLLVAWSRAPLRIGFGGAPGAFAYSRSVRWDPGEHAVRRYLALADLPGASPADADPAPSLVVARDAAIRVRRLIGRLAVGGERPLLCVAPGSSRPSKQWTVEGFAAVLQAGRRRGLVPVLIGAPGERRLCEAVGEASGVDPVNLAGRTGPQELVALVARSAAIVCNDSGAGHVASAVGTPRLCVLGPSDERFGYLPWGAGTRTVGRGDLPCRPCSARGPRRCPLDHRRCLTELAPRLVVEALDQLLAECARPRIVGRQPVAVTLPG